jgi:hypothetical protein
MGFTGQLSDALLRRQLTDVSFSGGGQWLFDFGGDARLNTAGSPWRLLLSGRIAQRDTDHLDRFGQVKPFDGMEELRRLLLGREVEQVTLRPETGDLLLRFSGADLSLEVINIGPADDGWLLWTRRGIRIAAKRNGELGPWAA